MRIGVAFSGGLTPSDVVECVKLAEALGYESAWVAEGHGGDQFAILGACAVATRRIRLGTSISSVFVRSATTIGMAAATVDQLAKGRFILGLGGSHLFGIRVSLCAVVVACALPSAPDHRGASAHVREEAEPWRRTDVSRSS